VRSPARTGASRTGCTGGSISMNEDQARNRSGNGPENLAVLRHMALNLRREEPSRRSLPKKPRRAARSDAFLAQRLMLLPGKAKCVGLPPRFRRSRTYAAPKRSFV